MSDAKVSFDGLELNMLIQESGSHNVAIHMPGGDNDGIEPDAEECSQRSVRDMSLDECTAEANGKTHVSIDSMLADDEKLSRSIDLAVSLMVECKASLQLSDLDTAVSLFREVLDERPITHPLYTEVMKNLASALGIRFLYTNELQDVKEALSLRDKISVVSDQGRNSKSDTIIRDKDGKDTADKSEFAQRLLTNFRTSTSIDALNDIIFQLQQCLPHLASAPTTRSLALITLVDALYARFCHFHDTAINDLNEAISCLEDAIECRTQQDWERSTMKYRICVLVLERFDLLADDSDRDAVSAWLENENAEGIVTFADILHRLQVANGLYGQFTESGNMDNLNTAITIYHEGMAQLPQGSDKYTIAVNNLAAALWSRYEQGGEQGDLDESIYFCREALELRPAPDPRRSTSLHSLASALWTRFTQRGEQSDLDEAISFHRQALELRLPPHPLRSSSLSNLAIALWTRYEQGGEQSDLDAAIVLQREAVDLFLPSHPDQWVLLNNLANTLSTRFQQGSEQDDLNEAITLHRKALAEVLCPPHPNLSASLSNLASVLWIRFEQGGDQSDLHEAISLHRQALELRPYTHVLRSVSLHNVASALKTRFEQRGDKSDLDEAVLLYREALELLVSSHPSRPMSLNNLASTLLARLGPGGEIRDLHEAVALYRQVLELRIPPHPLQSRSLNNLANALLIQFKEEFDPNDLDEAISLYRQALQLCPASHPDQSMFLHNLATALRTQFEQGGEQSHLDEAISLHRHALDLRIPPHPERSTSLDDLASSLLVRFGQSDQQKDIDEAMSLYSTATQYPFHSPSQCLRIAKRWIREADKYQHSSAMVAYSAALQTLPQVATLSLDVQSRQQSLAFGSDGLARDASRCAIRAGQIDKAVEFLEAGRSIFWSQVLSLRLPFDRLSKVTPHGPELAAQLQNIANALEIGSHRDVSAEILDNRKKLLIDQEAARLNRLNQEWMATLLKVRELNGFEDFLLPPRLSTLQTVASKHPVVLLIANEDQSHCLIMTSTIIHYIALPNLRTPILKILADNIRVAVSQSPISRSFIDKTRETLSKLLGEQRGISYQNDNEHSDGIFKFVLGMLWDELVKPVTDYLNIKKSGDAPILQWCPTGYFTFLPIHAAGSYDDDLSIDCAPDYFVSSYTPTIGALLAEPPSSSDTETFRMMAVIQSQELTSTKEELAKIRDHVSKDALVELGVPGSPAGVEAVASRLSDVSIVHFACHGSQELSKPLDSWLKLDDGPLRISRIMREKMPNGALAFLCACETATGDEKLPDEAMSIAASLIFCGFRRVVATMWAMMDKDGPTIADTFYRELFRGPDGTKALVPDVTRSAYALHIAVNELRAQKVSFRRWVPFIHMGQ